MHHIIRPEGEAHLDRPHVIVHGMKLYDDEVTLVDGLPGDLPEPELNVAIISEDGVRHHEPDLSYRRYRIGVEYEGEHHGREDQVVRDISRSERYQALGWTEVRISKRHMHDDARAAVAKIRAALVQAGWRPGR